MNNVQLFSKRAKNIALKFDRNALRFIQLCSISRPLVGAFGETKDADDKVKEVLEKVRTTLEEKVGKSFDTFEAISFKTQVVAGTNYLIKVSI